jgi:histidinol phosphatase-like PHP family hydrolase
VPGIGPSSTRVIAETLAAGRSPTVEQAIDAAGKRLDVVRRRALRSNVLSRAAVRQILADQRLGGPDLTAYRGDLQMHSVWSDGSMTLEQLVTSCARRGYRYAAVTDHSHGLPIARGMSMTDVTKQHREIDRINAATADFHLFKGIEANIAEDGSLDLSLAELRRFDIVLAAPHSKLRRLDDQTPRLIRAVEHPSTHILAHPRGRVAGTRAGIIADWDAVFERAAAANVAVEIDGDPARQDLDYELASRAVRAGCVFALDSDAHSPRELAYAETALAHARLAGIPPDRIVNCWTLDRLRRWLRDRPRPRRQRGAGRSLLDGAEGT